MRELAPFIITGIVTGSLYGLAGVGLVLSYRTSGVFNFGHGAIGAGAAYLFYWLHEEHGLPWPIVIVITLAAFGLIVGWVMEAVTRRLGDVPEAVVVVATVGVLLGVQGLLYIQFGAVTRFFPDFLPTSGFTVSDVNVQWSQVIVLIIASASAAFLYLFLQRTRLGVAMRAVVDNPTLVALAGDSPVRVQRSSWMISSTFAALSGVLLAPTLGLDATLLTLLVVQAFGACAVGLFKSLPLTYAGGIAIGVCASVATKYFTTAPFNGIPPAVPFLFLLVVLLVVKPSRLPKRRSSARSLVADSTPLPRAVVTVGGAAGVIALALVPHLVGPKLPIWISALTYLIILASLSLLVWTSGQISLCHSGFVAVGACAMGQLDQLPWGVAVIVAGLLTVPIGAIVAIPAIRLSGLYLALATLGFGILMQQVFFPTWLMFGSENFVTATRPVLGAINGVNDQDFYYVVLGLALASIVVIGMVARSRLGRLLRAMAETPTMLSTHGLSVNTTRLIVFCISAFFAGIGGALVVTQFGSASGVGYGPIQSMLFLAVLAICGTRLIRSAGLGAALFALAPGYLTTFDVDRQSFGFGIAALAAAIMIANRAQLTRWFQGRYLGSADRARSTVVRRREHLDAVQEEATVVA